MANKSSGRAACATNLRIVHLWIVLASSILVAQNAPVAPEASSEARAARLSGWSFDVVSIKPSDPKDKQWFMSQSPDLGEYRVKGMPLSRLMESAFFSWAYQKKENLQGAPDWVWQERYDFVGKVDASDRAEWSKQLHAANFVSASPMLQAMLQAALAERCKLIVHRVPTEIAGFALVPNQHGPNRNALHEAKPEETIPSGAIKLSGDARMLGYERGSNHPTVYFYQTSMGALASSLSLFVEGPVEDKRGLVGKYDFALAKWLDAEDQQHSLDLDALGLKLVPVKMPSEAIVIDYIERPTPD